MWQYWHVLRVLLRSFFGGVGEFAREEAELLGVLATVASMLSLPPAIEGGAGEGLSTWWCGGPWWASWMEMVSFWFINC